MQLHALDIAKVCHAANRELQAINSEQVGPTWETAPDWQRDSCLEGVHAALRGATPEELHEAWVAHKLADGWHLGETKDEQAKLHPCLVDYDDLPAEQRVKDDLFGAIVDALGEPTAPNPYAMTTDELLAGRHPSVASVARFLLDVNPNLPLHLHAIASTHRHLAVAMLAVLDDSAELTAGLRKLLEAKDCLVRAAL